MAETQLISKSEKTQPADTDFLYLADPTVKKVQLSNLLRRDALYIAPQNTGGADKYTTGTSDDVQIQAALDSIPSTAGKRRVVLLPGTYNVAARININKSNLEIYLCPGATIKPSVDSLSNSGFRTEYQGIFHVANRTTNATQTNVWIHGGIIDCDNRPNTNALSIWGSGLSDLAVGTTNILVEDMKFINKSSSTVAVSQVVLNGGNVNGVLMGRMSGVKFKNCIFEDIDYDAFTYIGDYYNDIVVRDCTFNRITRDSVVQTGYIIRSNSNIRVEDNKFTHTKLLSNTFGIQCFDIHDNARTGCTDMWISKNTFDNTDDPISGIHDCINIHGSHRVYIDDNTFRNVWIAISLGQSNGGGAFKQDGCHEVFITNNNFDHVQFVTFDNDANNVVHLRGNTFKEIGLTGFSCYSAHQFTSVENNIFYNCNNAVDDVALLAMKGLTPGTLPEYQKSVIELGGNDSITVRNNTVIDDRLLQDPGDTATTLSQVVGGSLPATTYFVKIAYENDTGVTLPSTSKSLAVSANNLLKVVPNNPEGYATVYGTISGIRKIRIYVGTVAGSETLQATLDYPNYSNSINGWTMPTTGLVSGAALPTSNTTHRRSTYGIYNVNAAITLSGPNKYFNNHFYGSLTPFGGINLPDPGIRRGNTLNNTLLADSGSIVTLTPGVTVNTDAFLSREFAINPSSNFTLANPINPTDGQVVRWRIRQPASGGPYTITLGSKFKLGTTISSVVLSTAASAVDYLEAVYNLANDKWDIVNFTKGY